ncbi:MAG: RND family transporter [FCB group bacterium]|nr:RND family transporter [FCB group bacterium]
MSLTRFVLKRPLVIIGLVILITVLFILQMKHLTMDPDITGALPKKIPAKRLYDRMTEIFPTKEFIFLGIEGDNIFSPRHLQDVWTLTKSLEKNSDIYQVMSPMNVSIIRGTDEGMVVEDILDVPPKTPEEIQTYRNRLFTNDLALGNLISRDSTMFGIMLLMKNTTDVNKFVEQFIPQVKKWDQETDLTLILAGKPVVSHYVGIGMQRDMSTFFMGGLGVIFILLLIIFRNLRGILLPLSVVILSVLWTLGAMALFGVPMSHSTEIMPILIMAIAVADSIHILTHYYSNTRRVKDKLELTRMTMADMNSPVIMTSLTTMAGFLALGTAGVESIITLGIFTASGVLFALLLSLTFVPAWLCLLPIPKRLKNLEGSSVTARAMMSWGNLLNTNRKLLFPFLIVVILMSIWGFSRLEHSFSSIGNFPKDHPIRIAHQLINDHFAGTTSFQIMVEGKKAGQIKDPDILRDMDGLKSVALSQDHVGDALSLADFIKRINKVLHGDDERYNVIPADKEVVTYSDFVEQHGEWKEVMVTDTVTGKDLVAQYLTLYEMSGKPDDMANLVDYDYQHAKISILMDSDDQAILRSIDRSLETYIDAHFENADVAVTGMAKLILVVDDLIVSGQINSILLSLFLVWLLTSIMFKSAIVGLFNTIPLFFAMLLNFMIMGLTGINVNLETMVISSIAIGVGVDYAIHFIYRYRLKLTESNSYESAVIDTMEDSGLAIAFNSFVVAAGFSIIAFSQFVAIMQMGVLITLTMATSAFGALTVLPLVFVNFKPKSLKLKASQLKGKK